MTISNQTLHSMKVKKLKNLTDLEISFEGSPITAILGPNGNGKSTILHALACAFSPNEEGEDYKFSSFFLPSTDALWCDSEMEIVYSYRDGQTVFDKRTREYKKPKDRWTPRYSHRPKRDIYYIGIDKCVPMIEAEKKQARINYSTQEFNEGIIKTILEKASIILNKKYSSYNIHETSGKSFIGVEVNNLRYSALSMSAGEQKVFYVLEKVFKAKKYSLILVDELDLLLHDQAMKRLVEVILDRATSKKLQIIFTTHRESILKLEDKINIRHIVSKENKTLCFNETTPDAINRLTGSQPKPIEVFVEDDLAEIIVKKVASQLGILRHISITKFGAAANCFTTVGGLLLGGEKCDNSLFVLDGDVYITFDEKKEAINKVLTGHDRNIEQAKEKAISIIKQFDLPKDCRQPEKYLHSLIIEMDGHDNKEFNEIIEISKEIIAPDEKHKYINDIINRIGFDRLTGISKIIDLVSMSKTWDEYTHEVYVWLKSKKDNLEENSELTV